MFKTVNEFKFGTEVRFFFLTALPLFFNKLAIARFFFLLSFDACKISFFLFSHSEKLDMLLLELVVNLVFFIFSCFLLSFLLQLLIKFLSHKTATFLLTKKCLFLFLVVQKLVELLNGGPFIFLSNFRVDLG